MIGLEVDTLASRALLGDAVDVITGEQPLSDLMAQMLADYEAEVFATENFGQWADNDPVTERAKNGGRVLVDTGRLRNLLTDQRAVSRTGDSVTLTTSDKVAGFLARGARGTPPRNPTPEPSTAQVIGWADDLLDHTVRLLGGRR